MIKLLKRLITSFRKPHKQEVIKVIEAVVPAASPLRGRLSSDDGSSVSAQAEPEPIVTMRVFRAATQTWEEI